MDPHAEPPSEVAAALDTDPDAGLSAGEAAARLEAGGPNEIRGGDEVSPIEIFASQFRDVLVYLLVLAAALSVAVGFLPGQAPEYAEAALILAILLANGLFGFVQDYRAERAILALRELSTPGAAVIRDGRRVEVDAREVVPGDVIVVEAGDAVPADARLVEATELRTDESALTGESTAVPKSVGVLPEGTPLAERANMVYTNTTAVAGSARAVVVSTGMDTEVGGIATQLAEAGDGETPFREEIDRLGRRIGAGVLALIAAVALAQWLFTAAGPVTIVLVAITLAVAAVPEGLPAVVTLTLALGSRALLERNALIRSLPVVESLGSVDVIVTDKTGTLTENSMTVRRLYFDGGVYRVRDAGPAGGVEFRTEEGTIRDPPVPLLRCGAVCNNAEREGDGYRGDPTETALLAVAGDAGVDADAERLREIPFTSDRKRMTVVAADGPTAYAKGAPGVILERCDRVLEGGEAVPLDDDRRERILERNGAFASDALRVLGFAYKPGVDPDADGEEIESGMVFLGLQGLIDPPRDEVPDAVADCRRAGIRVIMATGDNVDTARAIGREAGFDPEGALSGPDLDALDDDGLARAVQDVEVFARVDPGHKVRILRALQAAGHNVAMTGDGVNDAPALRNADVGIAMGQRGTDVAKGAADVILRDDNFATIRDAVAEGRGIFDNIRKFVNYLLSANAGEVAVVFVGVLVGTALFPERFAGNEEALVLTPVMLLWVNLVTDGLPALALGADPKADGVMDRPPRPPDEPVIDARMAASIVGIGAIMTLTGLGVFFAGLAADGLVAAQTGLFTFLVTVEVVRIQVIRSRYRHSILSNRWLVAAIASSLALQLLVLYTPLSDLFGVRPPDAGGWARIAGGFVAFLALNLLMVRIYDGIFDDP